MDSSRYLESLAAEFALLRAAATAVGPEGLAAPVPTCPGWTLNQLFKHVGRGNRWSAQIIRERRAEPLNPRDVQNGKPPEDPGMQLIDFH